jgi:hypothetical protein
MLRILVLAAAVVIPCPALAQGQPPAADISPRGGDGADAKAVLATIDLLVPYRRLSGSVIC